MTHRRDGYTMLEVTIALAIGAIVVSMLTGFVGRSIRTRAMLADRARTLTDVRAAALLLAADLEHTQPGSLRVERAHPHAPARITLERIAPEPEVVRWVVRSGALVREARHRFAAVAKPQASIVLDDVRHLDAQARADDRWHPTWTESHAPQAVTVTLEAAGLDELTLTITPHLRERT